MELAHVPLKETWSAMEGLLKANLTRNIGVANMTTSGLRDLISYATVPPAVLQVELHPYLQQAKLLRYAEEQGIVVTGFSPLGSASYVELSMATTSDSCLDTEIVRYLAVKHKKSPAQIVLKWAVQRGTSVIPKSSKAERVRENADLFDGTWGLSDEDMEAMGMLDKNKRFNDPGIARSGSNPALTPLRLANLVFEPSYGQGCSVRGWASSARSLTEQRCV